MADRLKVLLISSNRSRAIMLPHPLGLSWVASNLDDKLIDYAAFDCMFLDDYSNKLIAFLQDYKPDVIGISIRNIDDQNIFSAHSFIHELKNLVDICKRYSDGQIILGGPGFSIFPEACLRELEADMGIVGEGEHSLNTLLQRMKDKKDYSDTPGLCGINNCIYYNNGYAKVENLNAMLPPQRGLFDVMKYLTERGDANLQNVLTVQSKRGCPMNCIFCTNPYLEGKEVRLRAIDDVVREIYDMKTTFDMGMFHFVDSLFNYPVDYAEDLCREMIATNLDSRWSAIVSPKFLSEELMVLMKEAGCVQLHIGNESGSPKTLKSLQKEFSVDDIVNCFKLSHALEIFSMGYLLLGGPEEDLNTVEESISLMEEVKPSRLNITIGTRIYPHTPLYDISLREEVITTDNHLLQPAFYLARSIADVIWNRIEELEKTHPNWIVR